MNDIVNKIFEKFTNFFKTNESNLNEENLKEIYNQVNKICSEQTGNIIRLNEIKAHKEYCENIRNIYKNNQESVDKCPICLDELFYPYKILKCSHKLCNDCTLKLLKFYCEKYLSILCPLCRKINHIIKIRNNNNNYEVSSENNHLEIDNDNEEDGNDDTDIIHNQLSPSIRDIINNSAAVRNYIQNVNTIQDTDQNRRNVIIDVFHTDSNIRDTILNNISNTNSTIPRYFG